MEQTTRFGPYLLLKKLGTDAFGEVYRAGKLTDDGGSKRLSELYHLRLFSIPGLDPRGLLDAFRQGDGRVEGPGLHYADETGDVGGVPFVAYRYTPRRTLRTLIQEANTGFSDLSLDHAVLIAERIAKGLAVVHQEGKGAQSFHGLLTPDLIWVTGDGDIQINGLEFASTLVPLAQQGRLGDSIRPYLSPELGSGGTAAAIDDIYSLGAILSEMLTGEPPPSDITLQLSTHLATATVASSGEAIPEGLAELLQRSLLAAKGRTSDASKWYQKMVEWMGQADLQATHFDLAFFIHELFRDSLNKEKEAVAKEKERDYSLQEGTQPGVAAPPAPATAATTAAAATTAPPPTPQPAPHAPQPVSTTPGPIPEMTPTSGYLPPKKSNQGLLIGIGAVIFLALAASIFFVTRKPQAPPPNVAATQPAPVTTPAESAEESPGETEAVESDALLVATEELNRLMEEQEQSVSDQLDEEYETRIRMLQKQLEQARALERQEIQRQLEAPPPPQTAAEQPSNSAAGPQTASTDAAQSAATQSAATQPTTEQASTNQSNAGSAAGTEGSAAGTETPAQSSSGAAASPPPQIAENTSNAAQASPPPPAAKASPNPQPATVVPPKRLSIPNPVYPERARRLRKQAVILVSVLVGTNGKVVEAKPVSDETIGFGLDQSAISAARRAKFEPGKRDGIPTEMWTTVVISFKIE